ncbi:MAG: hypothetical protein ACYTGZ_21180 [Planctomycetota bacterium]|jgi:hypothetical protein
MSRITIGFLVAILIAGCGSGGDDGGGGLTARQFRALTCTRVTTIDIVRVLGRVEAVMLTALGDPQAGVTVDPSTDPGDPDHTFDYRVVFDADNDRTDDTEITGKITLPQDPASGIPGGRDIALSYDIVPLGATGPLRADGSATLSFETASQATIRGSIALHNDDTGCGGLVNFETDTTTRVLFSEAIASASQLTARIFGLRVWGKLGVNLTTEQNERFVGTIALGSTGQNVTVDGTLDGDAFKHTYSVWPDANRIDQLTNCIEGLAPVYGDMTAIFLALSEVIDGVDGDLSAVPPAAGLNIEVTANPDVANYAIDLTRFGVLLNGGRIDGQVRISRVGFRLAVLWSWRLNGRIDAEVVVGQSALFFRVQYDDQDNVTSVGEGSLQRDGCSGAFEIPESDPITQPLQSGTIVFVGQSGVHVIEADFAVGLGGAASRRVWIDDVPAPIEMVIQFAAAN